MEFLLAMLVFIFAITGTFAVICWRRAVTAEARIAQLEKRLEEALDQVRAADRAVPEPVPEPDPKRRPKPEPEPEPKPEAAPKPKPKPKPKSKPKKATETKPIRKSKPSTQTRDNPVYKHAVKMIQDALEMTRHLGFDAQVDGDPNVYRLSLDLRTARDQQAAVFLEKAPFACIKKLQFKDKKLVLELDTKEEKPA